MADWIIADANQEAADIRHEAHRQMAAALEDARREAAELLGRASGQAESMLTAAEQEAAELLGRASGQAESMLTAAEQEAAEIRAAVTRLSAELGGVAAHVTDYLAGFAPSSAPSRTGPAPGTGRFADRPESRPERFSWLRRRW
jgi:hypothetical protein